MKIRAIGAVLCCVWGLYGCGTTQSTLTTETAVNTEMTNPGKQKSESLHPNSVLFGDTVSMYARPKYDLIISSDDSTQSGWDNGDNDDNGDDLFYTDRTEMDEMPILFTVDALIREIENKEGKCDDRLTIAIAPHIIHKDKTEAYHFKIMKTLGDVQNWYVTKWGKIFKEKQYYGRINKDGADNSPEIPRLNMSLHRYEDVEVGIVKPFSAIEGFEWERAVTYIAHHVLIKETAKGCKKWWITLDGLSQVEGHPAYEFTVMASKFNKLAVSYDDETKSSDFKSVSRFAVTDNGKVYRYELKPEVIGQIGQVELPKALPMDSKLIRESEEYIKSGGWMANVVKESLKVKKQYIQYPNYRLKLEEGITDKNKMLKYAENIYRQVVLNASAIDGKVQSVKNGEYERTLTLAQNYPMSNKEYEWLIAYDNKMTMNGIDGYLFTIGQIKFDAMDIIEFKKVFVDDKNNIYRLVPGITYIETMGTDVKPLEKVKLDDRLYRKYASGDREAGRTSMCKGDYILIMMKNRQPGNGKSEDKACRISPDDAAGYIMENKDRFYVGSYNLNPMYVTSIEQVMPDGKNAYKFLVGQGTSASYPVYFEAAATCDGELYRYDDGALRFVENLPDTYISKPDDDKKDKEKTKDSDRKQTVADNTSDETGATDNEKVVYPVSHQTIDEVKAFYHKGYQLPSLKSQPELREDRIVPYEDFDYYENVKIKKASKFKGDLAAAYMNREILPKLKRYSGHYWTILLDTELSLDGRNAFVMSYGTLDHWDSFNREDAFIFSEDGNVYQPEEVYKFVKVMDVQPEPERKNNSFSASFGLNASIVTQYYPWFELGSPSPMPEVENYSIVQAAAEVEAAYLHDHNDGHWGIKYAGVVTIEGEKAWKFIVYYMDDPDSHDDGNIKYSFKVAATTGHKLYRYQTDLKQLGKLPAGYQPPAKEDTEKEKNYKPSYAKDLGIGSLCYDESIDDGPYVSLALAAYWALDLVAKDMPGRKNYNAPWWAVPSKTKFDGVDAFEFEIGQGKRNKEDTRVKAIVTQDRKIYKILKDKPEFVGSIPEDALEP